MDKRRRRQSRRGRSARVSASLLPPLAAVSFLGGFLALAALTLLLHRPSPIACAAAAPPWLPAGGLFGAFFAWAMLRAAPQTGVRTAMAALVPGQLLAALLLDATGAPGLAVQAVTPARIAAPGLVAAGLVLSRL